MLMTQTPKAQSLATALGLRREPREEVESASKAPWHVLLSEPQQEFHVQEWLLYRGFQGYVPALRWQARMRYFRRRPITVPMFRGYVFLQHDDDRDDLWGEVRNTRGARGGLVLGGHQAMLADEDVDKIRATERRIAESTFLKRKIGHEFKVGQRVRIDQDAFVGLAIIERLGEQERIGVLMCLLGRQTRISVHVDHVQPM